MRIIITSNGSKYIDQELKDAIVLINSTFNMVIPNDKNIFFLKNTTVPRLVTDYLGKNISRVIKKEKADFCIIKKIEINDYPLYYDAVYNCTTKDDTKEVVYSTSNLKIEDIFTLEQIVDFNNRQQTVGFINQDILNESFNNGFVIDKENYTTLKELIDSKNADNLTIAANMVINSDLNANWQWLCYLYLNNYKLLVNYDKNGIVDKYFETKLNLYFDNTVNNIDRVLSKVTDEDVRECVIQHVRNLFHEGIETYLRSSIQTSSFVLNNFELNLK